MTYFIGVKTCIFASFIGMTIALGSNHLPVKAETQSQNWNSFANWCLQRESLSEQAKYTVEILLEGANTDNCVEADQKLSFQSNLYLGSRKISDLTPLSSLRELILLNLSSNRIVNIKPLSSLRELKILDLKNNQVVDLTYLSPLTSLKYLILSNNEIDDVSALSSLTNLIKLNLYNNPRLLNKTCPVQPEKICDFFTSPGPLVLPFFPQVKPSPPRWKFEGLPPVQVEPLSPINSIPFNSPPPFPKPEEE